MATQMALLLALLVLLGAFAVYRRVTRYSIKYVRGPPRAFWLGNLRKFPYQQNVGELDFQYVKEYGNVWRMSGPLGQDVLMIADPKALQHIFHKSGYHYPKTIEALIATKVITGDSILFAPGGAAHNRHRKVMNPAFSAPQLRSFLPLFRRSANKLCRLWKDDVLAKSTDDGEVLTVNTWLARTTLDVIGETAFHFEFGALDNARNEVADAYHNMFSDSNLHPSLFSTLLRATWRWLPGPIVMYMEHLPTREYKRFRRTLRTINTVSAKLVDEKTEEAKEAEIEKSKKDVMSVLVRANLSSDPRTRLSKNEMISEMAALTLAGHETTANTLTWLLWELSKTPELQDRLRHEIREKRAELDEAGAEDFTMDDLESMPFLQALLKEVLRFHPIVYHLVRAASKDDVIPLSEPLVTENGKTINEIPVAKGQSIMISICAYNRLKSVWGEDADVFNPMRFLHGQIDTEVKVGMFANLMSFSAGVRGCIGWRFSLIEMQAILTALIEQFEFALPGQGKGEDNVEVLRMPVGLMSPMIKGRMHEGVQLPLRVRPVRV